MPAAGFVAAGTAPLEFLPGSRYLLRRGETSLAREMDDQQDFEQAAARRYIIKRPRLTRLLDESTARIILLVAPAGYGKTTLAREWLAERRSGWYQGTSASADVAALAVGLAEAVGAIVPDAGRRMDERLRATGTPEQDVQPLAELLAEDLAEWPDDAWLTIDDYHFAAESEASERFVDLVASLSPLRLFITSRVRPRWATARRLLYGEVQELGRNPLAMSHDEASEVLAHRKGTEASALVALADGWPAVIGLAALTEEALELPDGTLPDTLYDYFAEELYQAAAPDVQWGLSQLALTSVTTESAEFLLGAAAPTVLSEGLRLGFLTSPTKGTLEVHPLLRTFLESKFREHSPAATAEVTARLGRHLVDREVWDDAFSLVERFFTEELFVNLLEGALPSLLMHGRLPTLTNWVEYAARQNIDSPVVDLAEAEVAFRESSRERAEALAVQAARRLGDSHRSASRAFFLAGMCAHLSERNENALEYHTRAQELAQTESEVRDALWGRLLSTVKLARPDVEGFVNELTRLNDGSATSQLRLHQARFITRTGIGSFQELLDLYDSSIHLLPKVSDPVTRSSFRTSYAQLLAAMARYEAAMVAANETAVEAKRDRLDFVIPYTHLVKAMAESGLRNFARATVLIDRIEKLGLRLHDAYLVTEALILQIRLLVSEGLADEALLLETHPGFRPSPPEYGEYLASQALARACSTNWDGAVLLADQAEGVTQSPEVRGLAPCVRAIAALRKCEPAAQDLARHAFDIVKTQGNLDCFVSAYRGWPPLLKAVAEYAECRPLLSEILTNARDDALAKSTQLPIAGRLSRRRDLLSPRETEIYQLLAQGLSNKQIAKLLYISEATVKVHVRHVFDKLGVRSRTAVALRASSEETS